MIPRLNITVAGAGMGGLAAAIGLTLTGHRVRLLDQFQCPRPVGSGLVVQPVGLWALDALGAGAQARSLGQQIERLYGRSEPCGARALDVRYDAGRPGRTALGIHRASLFQALLDRATALGISPQPGRSIAGVRDTAEGAILICRDGSQLPPADLVVDALGANSPLSPLQGRPLDWGALWTTLAWPDDCGLPPTQLTQRYRAARQMMGVLPVGRLPDSPTPRAAFFWSLPRDSLDTWRSTRLSEWKGQMLDLWPDAHAFVEQIRDHEQMIFAAYSHGHLRKPWQGRVVQIGDAAHRASPQLGQGANMALLDAIALTLALDEVPVDRAPARYARMRRLHLAAYQGLSRLITPQYQSNSRFQATMRDRLVGPLSRLWPVTRMMGTIASGSLLPPLSGPGYRRNGLSARARLSRAAD